MPLSFLDEPQNTEFKRINIDFIKEFKEFKGSTKKELNESKSRELKENEPEWYPGCVIRRTTEITQPRT